MILGGLRSFHIADGMEIGITCGDSSKLLPTLQDEHVANKKTLK